MTGISIRHFSTSKWHEMPFIEDERTETANNVPNNEMPAPNNNTNLPRAPEVNGGRSQPVPEAEGNNTSLPRAPEVNGGRSQPVPEAENSNSTSPLSDTSSNNENVSEEVEANMPALHSIIRISWELLDLAREVTRELRNGTREEGENRSTEPESTGEPSTTVARVPESESRDESSIREEGENRSTEPESTGEPSTTGGVVEPVGSTTAARVPESESQDESSISEERRSEDVPSTNNELSNNKSSEGSDNESSESEDSGCSDHRELKRKRDDDSEDDGSSKRPKITNSTDNQPKSEGTENTTRDDNNRGDNQICNDIAVDGAKAKNSGEVDSTTTDKENPKNTVPNKEKMDTDKDGGSSKSGENSSGGNSDTDAVNKQNVELDESQKSSTITDNIIDIIKDLF